MPLKLSAEEVERRAAEREVIRAEKEALKAKILASRQRIAAEREAERRRIAERPNPEAEREAEEERCRLYFALGGECKLFEPASTESVRLFGGVLLHPPRTTLRERPPACGLELQESCSVVVLQEALRASGLYRESSRLNAEKKGRRDESAEQKALVDAVNFGLVPQGSAFDPIMTFDDIETISQLVSFVKSHGNRIANYTVGKRDGELKMFDGRLIPTKGRGMGTLSRPFRGYILDQCASRQKQFAFDVDFSCCYPRILLQFAKHIGEPTPMLESYIRDYDAWKKDIPECKLVVLISIFRPDAPPSHHKDAQLRELEVEIKRVANRLVQEQPALVGEGCDGGSSPLGSALCRLFQRVERSLIEEAMQVFVESRMFTITTMIYDGFTVCSNSNAVDYAKAHGVTVGDVAKNLIHTKVNNLYQGAHVATIKPFEYPRDKALDMPPSQCFDFEHKVFGRLDASYVMQQLSCIEFPSYDAAFAFIAPWVSWMVRIVGGGMVAIKHSGAYDRPVFNADGTITQSVVKEQTMDTVSLCVTRKDASSLQTLDFKGSITGLSVVNVLSILGGGSMSYTGMLPVEHPLMQGSHMFTGRIPPIAVRNACYRDMKVSDALVLCKDIISHFRDVICVNVPGGFEFLMEFFSRTLRTSKAEVCPLLVGSKGGELKSGIVTWFADCVLGAESSLIQPGINDFGNRFRSELMGKVLVVMEELKPPTGSALDEAAVSQWKRQLTEKMMMIELKGVDKKRKEYNLANDIALTNFEETLKLSAGISRRVVVYNVSDCKVGDRDYMSKMFSQFNDPRIASAFAKLLLTVEGRGLLGVKEYDPSAPMDSNSLKRTDTFVSGLFNGLPLLERVVYMGVAGVAMRRAEAKANKEGVDGEFPLPESPAGVVVDLDDLIRTGLSNLSYMNDKGVVSTDSVGRWLGARKVMYPRISVAGVRKRVLSFTDDGGLIATSMSNADGMVKYIPLFDPVLWNEAIQRTVFAMSPLSCS